MVALRDPACAEGVQAIIIAMAAGKVWRTSCGNFMPLSGPSQGLKIGANVQAMKVTGFEMDNVQG